MPDPSGQPSPRVVVIGCGSIGKRHLRNLLALGVADVVAYDPREDRREEVRTTLNVETISDLDEAWKRDRTLALITAPTSLHVPLAQKAAEHGCHLFIEKPLSDRLEGVEPLLSAVRERHLISLVGCNMRFHPGLMTIKQLLERGAIGRVVTARVEAGQYLPDWHPREDYRQGYSARRNLGGGVLMDGVHEIDYVRWLFGEVTSVACVAGQLSHLDIDTEDTASLLLRFASGTIGEIHLDYIQRIYSRSCHLIGDEGTIRWDFTAGETRCYTASTRAWEVFANPPGWEANQMYVDEMRHLLRCLQGEEASAQDAYEGARVLEIALAARTSADVGRVIECSGEPFLSGAVRSSKER